MKEMKMINKIINYNYIKMNKLLYIINQINIIR